MYHTAINNVMYITHHCQGRPADIMWGQKATIECTTWSKWCHSFIYSSTLLFKILGSVRFVN